MYSTRITEKAKKTMLWRSKLKPKIELHQLNFDRTTKPKILCLDIPAAYSSLTKPALKRPIHVVKQRERGIIDNGGQMKCIQLPVSWATYNDL